MSWTRSMDMTLFTLWAMLTLLPCCFQEVSPLSSCGGHMHLLGNPKHETCWDSELQLRLPRASCDKDGGACFESHERMVSTDLNGDSVSHEFGNCCCGRQEASCHKGMTWMGMTSEKKGVRDFSGVSRSSPSPWPRLSLYCTNWSVSASGSSTPLLWALIAVNIDWPTRSTTAAWMKKKNWVIFRGQTSLLAAFDAW